MESKKHILIVTLFMILFCLTASASDKTITPLPGDPLRKQILDTLRQEVKRIHGLDVVFVVRHMKVIDGWSLVHTLPQSPDGKNRYEGISALLQFINDEWKVVDIPCTEVDNPECLDGSDYFKKLQSLYPEISVELFPDTAAEPGS